MSHNWSPQKYIDLVENSKFPMLQEYQRVELDYITSKIKSPQEKTFIDVGAGYGRALSSLANIAGGVIAVEIDQNMLEELRGRARTFGNVQVIGGDTNRLSELLHGKDIQSPVLISLQNSLGTWKGDYKLALEEMKKVAQQQNGELVISLLRQEALGNRGIPMYWTLKELVGEPDLERTNFRRGIFRSKTGYISRWWTAQDRADITQLLDGERVEEILNPAFWILHLKY